MPTLTQSPSSSQPGLLGIIGHPIEHTLSPVMHTAAFRVLHLPFVFGVFDVVPEFLPALLLSLRTIGIVGASVTIPHKQSVLPLLDEITDDAAALGAVNTIVRRGEKLIGYNTDMLGVKESLEPVRKKIEGSSVLILGAGGAARGVVYAISQFFRPTSIVLHNRSVDRAKVIAREFRKLFPSVSYEIISEAPRVAAAVAEAALIVNSTSVGMSPQIDAVPLPATIAFSNQQIIFDIIYNPVETALLRRARLDGARTINGVEMFVQQGSRAFELWTGKKLPLEKARAVVMNALRGAK